MAWISDPSLQPPSGWTFKEEKTGITLSTGDYTSLLAVVARHRQANDMEIGDVEKDVNEYLCAHNPPNFCQAVRGLGDAVALFANPIAKGLDAVLGTRIQGCGGCAARRTTLNRVLPV